MRRGRVLLYVLILAVSVVSCGKPPEEKIVRAANPRNAEAGKTPEKTQTAGEAKNGQARLSDQLATARKAAELMRDGAYAAGAFELASEAWRAAERLRKEGQESERRGDYTEALAAYRKAGSFYMEAEAAPGQGHGTGTDRLLTAVEAMELMKAEARKAEAEKHAPELWFAAEQHRMDAAEFLSLGEHARALEVYLRAGSKYMEAETAARRRKAAETVARTTETTSNTSESERLRIARIRDSGSKEISTGQPVSRSESFPIREARIIEPGQVERELSLLTEKERAEEIDHIKAIVDGTAAVHFATESAAGSLYSQAGSTAREYAKTTVPSRDFASKPVSSTQSPESPGGYENMVKIPAGVFTMGSSSGSGDVDERPEHQVRLDGFYMDRREVTNEDFCTFLNQTTGHRKDGSLLLDIRDPSCQIEKDGEKYVPGPGRENQPVVLVTWHGAMAYAEWEGKRLPTEAEWEYACRAGTMADTAEGDGASLEDASDSQENRSDTSQRLALAGDSAPNAWGLYNMYNNVWEWCSDWYAVDYYKNSPPENPGGPDKGTVRVVRGGLKDGKNGSRRRPAYRNHHPPGEGNATIGFRCVRDMQ